MKIGKIKLAGIVAGGFLIVALVCNVVFLLMSKPDFPDKGIVLFRYERSGTVNGDFVSAVSGTATKDEYMRFVAKLGLESMPKKSSETIGYIPSSDDVPDVKWEEPINPELKYHKLYDRSYVRCVYHRGKVYFYSQGW